MPVYMIRAGDDGPVKIGWSKKPATRKAMVQPAHYLQLVVMREIDCAAAGERTLHAYFKSSRIRGEWFDYQPEMLTITIEDAEAALALRHEGEKSAKRSPNGRPRVPSTFAPEQVRALRGGLTQAAFARAYGVPVRTLQDWEHDRRKPDGAALSLLRAIAAAPDIMRELLA